MVLSWLGYIRPFYVHHDQMTNPELGSLNWFIWLDKMICSKLCSKDIDSKFDLLKLITTQFQNQLKISMLHTVCYILTCNILEQHHCKPYLNFLLNYSYHTSMMLLSSESSSMPFLIFWLLSVTLDEFCFRWFKNSVIEIGKA